MRMCWSSAFGPSLSASRGDPLRRLTAWVPPCSRSVQGSGARIAPRFPRPPPAGGPRRSRQCRSGPIRTAQREAKGETISRGTPNLEAPDDRTSANGWRRPGAHPPGGEFRHRSLSLDGMVREVSEDGWGGRRQDPLAEQGRSGRLAERGASSRPRQRWGFSGRVRGRKKRTTV